MSSIDASASAAFAKAKRVEVSVESWRVDRIEELPYERWIQSVDSGVFGEDLSGEDWKSRRVMDAAIAVEGFEAKLEFEESAVARVRAAVAKIDASAGLDVQWTTETTLSVASKQSFYIAGSFVRLNGAGGFDLVSNQPKRSMLAQERDVIPPSAKVVPE